MNNKRIVEQILEHPDKSEIISKMVVDIPNSEIWEWLGSKYEGNKSLLLSKKTLDVFKKEYLDIYSKIREDTLLQQFNMTASDEMQLEIQGNTAYKKRLEEMVDKELDIKNIIKKLVVSIEFRADQVFEQTLNNPLNLKHEKIIVDWFRLLGETLEKFDKITNGDGQQINIQNNINIQVVDQHINTIYSIIREILEGLDYEASLAFTEAFSRRIGELRAKENAFIQPVEKRLEAAYEIQEVIKDKLFP